MKKMKAAALAAVMLVQSLTLVPFSTTAAGSTYEFENGTIYDMGDNVTAAVTLTGASGGRAVGLKDAGDSVTVNVTAAEAGMHTLTIRYSQPYDEGGKYQNVKVNGAAAGEILCAYTGEGNFSTATLSVNLTAGSNAITVEGAWGWSYLDSLTVSRTAAAAYANPIISRGVPAHANNSGAASGNDDKYYTSWSGGAGDYLAYDLSSVPENQRRKVVAVWYNTGTYDDVGVYVNKSNEPVDYTIEVNAAPGGSYPADGWKTVETVTGNPYSSRQHVVDMDGYNWIRMKINKASGDTATLNLDIHDASNGVNDSWIFFGDSITAGGMGNAWGTSFATHVNQLDSRYFPIQENGGIGGTSSNDGRNRIDAWLRVSPAKYVSIAYGTNDAWGNPNNVQSYYENTKYMIDAVLAAGKIPVLPKIPYATNSDVGSNTAYYNAKIDQLYSEYGDKLVHGPDFDAYFRANPSGLSEDGVHPNSEGYEGMRQLWAETMYRIVYQSLPAADNPSGDVRGDVNNDGAFTVIDLVAMQKWLLDADSVSLENPGAGDVCADGTLNVYDLAVMKKLLVEPAQAPEVKFEAVYEAENAAIGGSNAVMNESGASGGKVVGSFSGDGDTLTFTIEVPEAGSYCMTVISKGEGGDKINNLLVDGTNMGEFSSAGSGYGESSVRRVILTAGTHEVSIQKSWGWITVDCLKVTEDEAIQDSVYNVSNTLINPNADANAQELFDYLCGSYGKYTLAGQVGNDGMNSPEFQAIYEATGKYPAIVGLDMMDYCPSRVAQGARSNAVETAIDFHENGGIATFCWHWNAPDKYMKPGTTPEGNPRWWGGFNTSNTDFDIAAVMNGSDPEGKALIDADIAEIAKQLNRLRDAGVPVLWRPLHEASGGWFWWGAKGPDAYKKLWCYLYDQLTNVYGCSNLIWVWNGQAADWYPGDEYVDIIGEDIYTAEHNYGAQNAKFSELLEYPGTNKITALTENGVVFDIDNVVAANAHWAWFGTWCGDFVVTNGSYNDKYTERDIMRKTYNSEYVITLDELPWYNGN